MADHVQVEAWGDFFEGLAREREEFFRISRRKSYAKDAFVFFQGDEGERVYCIDEGQVKISRLAPCGKESIVFLRGAGQLFGLAEAMAEEPRRASAQAVTPVSLRQIEGRCFKEFLRRHPDVAVRVGEILGRRLRDLCAQVETLTLCNPVNRFIRLLFALAQESGIQDGDAVRIPLGLCQAELAAMIGSCRQTVNQLLRGLEAENLIRTGRAGIWILHMDTFLSRGAAGSHPAACCPYLETCVWPFPGGSAPEGVPGDRASGAPAERRKKSRAA